MHAAELETAATAALIATILDIWTLTVGRPFHGIDLLTAKLSAFAGSGGLRLAKLARPVKM
jgi:hypothetical protein